MTIHTAAQELGATVIVGRSPADVDSDGYLYFADFNAPPNLNNNVTLYNNADIINYKPGQIYFCQTANSDTAGGITRPAGSTSKIENYGKMKRVHVDAQNQTLKIVPPVQGLTTDSLLKLGNNCRIEFTNKYIQDAGNFQQGSGSRIKGFSADGGNISLEDPGVAGAYDTYFDDDLTVNAGTIEFVQTTAGAYGTVHVGGDFTLGTGTTVKLNVNGSAAGNSDRFQLDGAVTLAGTLDPIPVPGFVGGSPITVIDNTGSIPISGYFAGLPEGAPLRLGIWEYKITYVGGNGNDVVLNQIVSGAWATGVVNVSSEFNASPGDWSAAKALGAPDVFGYGDNPNAWSPASLNGTQEFITVSFPNAVYPQGVTIRETYGNGFVTRVDLIDTGGTPYTIWTGTDPTQPGSPGEFTLSFLPPNYAVDKVKIYTNTDNNPSTWEQIDAVILYGEAAGGGGGFAPLSGGGGGSWAATLASVRSFGLSRPGTGPRATFAVSGPVVRGAPVTFVFSSPSGGSGYRYSFDFNNDGDFLDRGEIQDGTSPSATHTFTTRGWHVVRGRIRSADGRFTDYWLRVFVA